MTLLKEFRLADECSENLKTASIGPQSTFDPDLVSTLLSTSKYKDTGGLFNQQR